MNEGVSTIIPEPDPAEEHAASQAALKNFPNTREQNAPSRRGILASGILIASTALSGCTPQSQQEGIKPVPPIEATLPVPTIAPPHSNMVNIPSAEQISTLPLDVTTEYFREGVLATEANTPDILATKLVNLWEEDMTAKGVESIPKEIKPLVIGVLQSYILNRSESDKLTPIEKADASDWYKRISAYAALITSTVHFMDSQYGITPGAKPDYFPLPKPEIIYNADGEYDGLSTYDIAVDASLFAAYYQQTGFESMMIAKALGLTDRYAGNDEKVRRFNENLEGFANLIKLENLYARNPSSFNDLFQEAEIQRLIRILSEKEEETQDYSELIANLAGWFYEDSYRNDPVFRQRVKDAGYIIPFDYEEESSTANNALVKGNNPPSPFLWNKVEKKPNAKQKIPSAWRQQRDRFRSIPRH